MPESPINPDYLYNEHRLLNDITETYGANSKETTVLTKLINERNRHWTHQKTLVSEREQWRHAAIQTQTELYKALNNLRIILDHGN